MLLALAALLLGGGLLWAAAAAGFAPAAALLGTVEAEPTEEAVKAGADTPSVEGTVAAEGLAIPQKEAADPRYAFLLMGYGGGNHEGGYLSDSMMVVIVDPNQKTLAMLSLPRDTWAPMVFDGKNAIYNKLNCAYAFAKDSSLYRNRLARYTGKNGAGRFAADTVSRLLGIPINNYMAIDFQGFRNMIDAVGGIDVNVPESFSARYPANDDPSIDPGWITVRFTKGVEHMSGERAIRFARARDAIDNIAEGSDFARSRRQRLIMEAFKNKMMSPSGLLAVPQLLTLSNKHIDTDYALPDAPQFAKLALDWKDMRIYQTALTLGNYLNETTGPQGAYIVVPDAPGQSWAQVRAFAQRFWQDPAAGVAMANLKITVENASGKTGLASSVSESLRQMGYRVNEPVTGDSTLGVSRLVDRAGGQAKALGPQLERDLKQSLQVSSNQAALGDALLQLGSDAVALADLRVAADAGAPTSSAGVVGSGGWAPVQPAVATPTRRDPAPTSTAVKTTPTAGTPLATTTGTPGTPVPTRAATLSPSPTRTPNMATAVASTATRPAAVTPTQAAPTPTAATKPGATATPTTAAPTATKPATTPTKAAPTPTPATKPATKPAATQAAQPTATPNRQAP
ncbi:MAG: LCP family protein [Chloroflexota bacterium]